MLMERHQVVALVIYLVMVAVIGLRAGVDGVIEQGGILFMFLLPILFVRVIAYYSSFGFWEFFAKDFGSGNSPGPYAFFFWMLFIIACLFTLFGWSIY